ncbi:MAG: 4Fe-4S binding protein [Deltaproteobacteria bacterium]|nr:4Fe-4S binding protein [Deltaproteobacteria bacterium]
MKIKRKIIHIDEDRCDGCGQCVPSCAEGAIQVIDGKARLVAEKYCDGLGACMGECPQGALSIVEREAERFDEEAVEEHVRRTAEQGHSDETPLACGCPSSQIQTFSVGLSSALEVPPSGSRSEAALSHWPVQIRLVPPSAPFLQGADLLVAADCTAFAYANFHRDFVRGKVVLVGCPKFDDGQAYVERFTEIFKRADIKKITVLIMEVPCCRGLPAIVEKAMVAAGKRIAVEKVVISARGRVLDREAAA